MIKFSSLRVGRWLAFGTLAFGMMGAIANGASQIPIQASSPPITADLNTEVIWQIEPGERNPHRRTWALERELDWASLSLYRDPKNQKKTRVKISGLKARFQARQRPEGQWYSSDFEFPCGTNMDPGWFANLEGSRIAAQTAGDLWLKKVEAELLDLELRLGKISAKNQANARLLAQYVLAEWKSQINQYYQDQIIEKARQVEWKHYLAKYSNNKFSDRCLKANKTAMSDPRPEKFMEVPESRFASRRPPKPLARVPARIWGGAYSVRVRLQIGTAELSGKFLLDTTSDKSFVSPTWLKLQGYDAKRIIIQGARPQRISWRNKTWVSAPIMVSRTRVTTVDVPVQKFWLMDTDVFLPPEHIANCCDGTLGLDVLNQFAWELVPEVPSHVLIYDRKGFSRPSKTYAWVEASRTPSGLMSRCELSAGKNVDANQVFWNSTVGGSAWGPSIGSAVNQQKPWSLDCGQQSIAHGSFGEASKKMLRGNSFAKKLGRSQAVLGSAIWSRGRVALDIAHGRIWFDRSILSQPVPENQSGVRLGFMDSKTGGRVLKIKGLQLGRQAAQSLYEEGLRVGDEITEINGTWVGEMDQWQVNRLFNSLSDGPLKVVFKKTGKPKLKTVELPPSRSQ